MQVLTSSGRRILPVLTTFGSRSHSNIIAALHTIPLQTSCRQLQWI